MIATQALSIIEIPDSDKIFDYEGTFGLPSLGKQAFEISKGIDSFCQNILDINLEQNAILLGFRIQCDLELGERKGKKAFTAWLKSLGSLEYIARAAMKVGRWFNSLEKGEQNFIRENVRGWKLSFLKKLMKFPIEEIVDLVVEGNLKQVVVGGVKEKKRELRVDGYAKVVAGDHKLKNKVGRLAHQYEDGDWLLEITDLENFGLTESRFKAEDLSLANKPRSASKKLDQLEEKHHKVLHEVEEEDVIDLNFRKTDTKSTIDAGVDTNNFSQERFSPLEKITPSTSVDSYENSEKSSEVITSGDLEQIIAQVKVEAEKAAFAKAQTLFEQKLKEKELELDELRSQHHSMDKLLLSQEELDEQIKNAVVKERKEKAAETLTNQHLRQELEKTKQELEKARLLQVENQQLRQQIENFKKEKAKVELIETIKAEKEHIELENQNLRQQIWTLKRGFSKLPKTPKLESTQEKISTVNYPDREGEIQSVSDNFNDHELVELVCNLRTEAEAEEIAALNVDIVPSFESFDTPGGERQGCCGSEDNSNLDAKP